MARYARRKALRTKIEAVYGTDSAPTGTDNAILALDFSVTPLEAEEVSRDLIFPYLGSQGVIVAGIHARMEFSVEIAGSGAAGTVPRYGALLRSAGLFEAITVATKVDYTPVSAGIESVTHYFDEDGIKYVFVGSRCNLAAEFVPKGIPRWRFSYLGLYGALPADVALPTVSLGDWIKPVAVSKANTAFALHGVSAPTERISIDMGNQVEARLLIGAESIEIVDRRASGSAVIEAGLLATKNWDAIARAGTTGAMTLTHGTVAGNIVEITSPAVQIGRYRTGVTQGIVNNTLPLMLLPVTGNDEIKISVK